ncbi:AraC family transcriptional regulator [Pseudorhodoferax sp.]|uniref:AraC family transcriptional regulator n=1 Tax=Pseudorhodoferax sp. TaxID=1993553 RepID=UPI002DD69911|nr:helix-turn-helix transcriptional regulator [Pseudorhodoferax sp.]
MTTRPPRFEPLGDTDPFSPDPVRPVRVRARSMPADTHFEPHRHPWAQLAYCATGTLRVRALPEAERLEELTYIVPPSRAVWIAPGQLHCIDVLEAAQFRTLYLHAGVTPAGWSGSRMIVASPLLRELVQALDLAPHPEREALLARLVLDEITHADPQALAVPMPHAQRGDKRLRAVCEAVLRTPAARTTLAAWAADVGASERTIARLFRDELGTSYQQWRQQAALAHALPLLAQGASVAQAAAATGYASESAFSAMFKAAMGQPPSSFQGR